MAFFKILLIILVAMPVVFFTVVEFIQLVGSVRAKNRADRERAEMIRAEAEKAAGYVRPPETSGKGRRRR